MNSSNYVTPEIDEDDYDEDFVVDTFDSQYLGELYEEGTPCHACFGTGLDRELDSDCLTCWGDGVL